jgi:hypothetical protein
MVKSKRLVLTDKDRKEMQLEIERNRRDRLKFVREYAEWLKKTPNKVWSKQQVKYFGGGK